MQEPSVGGNQPLRSDEPVGATGGDRAWCQGGTEHPEKTARAARYAEHWGHIPVELRARTQWLIAVPDRTGACKVPVSVNTHNELCSASSTGRGTWLTFNRAAEVAYSLGVAVGYVLSADDPFTCIDLDVKNAVNERDPSKWTSSDQIALFTRMVQSLNTYTERSQSGLGLHLWARGKIGAGRKRNGVEVYSQERFIVCTGDVWLARPIQERQEWLTNMISQMPAPSCGDLIELPPLESDCDHWHRKARARNGRKFLELWNGRWQALGEYPSQSEADLALIRLLVFNNPSNEQVRRMFLASKLGQRDKPHKHRTYLNGLIRFARGEEDQRRAQSTAYAEAMRPFLDAGVAAYRAKWGAQ